MVMFSTLLCEKRYPLNGSKSKFLSFGLIHNNDYNPEMNLSGNKNKSFDIKINEIMYVITKE